MAASVVSTGEGTSAMSGSRRGEAAALGTRRPQQVQSQVKKVTAMDLSLTSPRAPSSLTSRRAPSSVTLSRRTPASTS